MPMSKLYVFRRGFFALWLFAFPALLMSQGLSCLGGLRASLDEQCEIVISANSMVIGLPSVFDTNRYEITVTPMIGSSLNGVMTGSGLGFISGNVGSLIQFTEPGAFTVSVEDLNTGISCWGDFYVEDKLPPRLSSDCMCPDTATVVTPECTFSCASIDEFYQDSSMTTALNPSYQDNCGQAVNVFFEDELINDSLCGSYYIFRTWKAKLVTEAGESDQIIGCKQKFKFDAIDNTDILSPESRVIVECGIDIDPESLRNYFSDTSYFTNPNLNTAVKNSFPYTIDNVGGQIVNRPISLETTDVQQYCKIVATYTDTDRIIPDVNCPHAYKIVRTWKILDWCNKTTRNETQIIAVMDNEAPEFETNDTIPMSTTNPWTCVSDLVVPSPIDSTIIDNCTDKNMLTWLAKVQVGTSEYIAESSNGYRLQGLMPGSYNVIYEMSDQCGNVSNRSSLLMIKDSAEPVVITKDKIIVTLSTSLDSCFAKVFPHNIDVGSYDACSGSELSYEMKRLSDSIWRPHIKFDQNDITSITDDNYPFGEHMIELRVTDIDGNQGIGWTTVRVEDKNSDLEINCGPDVVSLGCDSDFPAVITDSLYSPVVLLRSCTTSRLNVEYEILESNINESCNVGVAKIAYFIDGSIDTLCVKEFRMGDLDALDIDFPQKEIEVSCDEEDFGSVTINGETCNLLAESVEDQEFELDGSSGGFCKKIIRTYTIIDWCLYQPNQADDTGLYTFSQTIKVKDDTKPVITCESTNITTNEPCGASNFIISVIGSDSGCSDVLSWTAKVDLNGDNIYDLDLDPIIGENGAASVLIDTIIGVGTHSILWRATDECGNSTEEECEFIISDNEGPQAQCITGIVTTVMNTSGSVAIWASDFAVDGKFTDECGNPITYSFSGDDPNVNNLVFTCDSIANGVSTTKSVRVYVWDEMGNNNFCTVQITIDDNVNACEDMDEGAALIAGHVSTVLGDNVESAQVTISQSGSGLQDQKDTEVDGSYTFGSNPMYADYSIDVQKNDDYTNGVTTLDLVMIQQYILSLREFDSPYTIIASDVNGDEKVTALDLVEMRRVILGASESFSSQESWRFIDAEQTFENINDPWPLNEGVDLLDLNVNQRNLDFIAVKLGDVNGNAVANSLLAGSRSQLNETIIADDISLLKGSEYAANYMVQSEELIYGLELNYVINGSDINYIKVNGSMLSEEFYHQSGERLKISIISPLGTPSMNVELNITSSVNQNLSEAIRITPNSSSEIYIGEELTDYGLTLDYNRSMDKTFELYQNEPNPFAGKSNIQFYISQSNSVELSIFDITGRQVYYDQRFYDAGLNEIVIDESQLNAKGILYYQVSAGDNVATKKMIIME